MPRAGRSLPPEEPEVGPWATEKLAHLEKYLTAYTRVLAGSRRSSGWPKRILYVDAFAGGGKARVRSRRLAEADLFITSSTEARDDNDFRRLLDGSPVVAQRIQPPFTELVFVEQDRSLAARLRARLGDDPRVHVVSEDCNACLNQMLLIQPAVWWQQTRALIFLDPFGMQVPWSTIQQLADQQGIEVILNLPMGMAVQRLLPRHGKLSSRERSKLDDFFGDAGWFDVAYATQPSLFESELVVKQERTEQNLVDWYASRLRAAFGHATAGIPVRNTRGKTLYHLIWAGHHPKGLQIARRVFSP